jgi:hypothetical protein
MGLLDWLLPRPDRKPADIPQTASRWLPDSEVQPVSCPPCRADMPRVSVLEAAKEQVQPKAAHGFLIRSKSSCVGNIGQEFVLEVSADAWIERAPGGQGA